jgi:uncharacterized protein (DUF983 family)
MRQVSEAPDPRPSWLAAGLAGRCPRCGRGQLFRGFLALQERCTICGNDFTVADTGDGPSFFATLIGGFLVLGAGVWMQIAFDPPPIAYVAVFVVGALLTIAMLRPLKGILTALQYARNAREARFSG